MPTKACCCDPKGRHVAVACRYYGWHTATYVKDAVGNSAGDPRFVGPDGFTIKDFGYQRLFGLTLTPLLTEELETLIRGPYTWNASIKQFDATRDVILLSRSGGGSSQYTKDQINLPKGGNSSLLQTRVKASLAMEANVGAGGSGFGGGKGTGIGSILSPQYNPNSVPGGGAGGGVNGAGGHGGITNGGNGFGTGNGLGGSQTAGGCAGGSGAFNGLEYIGGTGAPESGGGGGGRYSGGGGASKAGGGGAASKWPAGVSGFSDLAFSEEGSNRGPGGICDPFVPLQEALYHYGMGGGSNFVQDPPTGVGPASPTNFLGFGLDYNPTKEGTPGVVRAIWIDKYCPCNEDDSKVLPDKMYICLTDAQYAVIENEMNVDDPVFNLVKFDLDGETYIYFGRCVNAYCTDIRLVDGTPENIRQTDITNIQVDQGGQGVLLNDCCKTHLCVPICPIGQANCFTCNNCYNCVTNLKAKYCCDNVEDKPDRYWSIYENYLWVCSKTNFWLPFGVTPEQIFPSEVSFPIFGSYGTGNYEKVCLPVNGDLANEPIPYEYCQSDLEDCGPYLSNASPGINNRNHPCHVQVGALWEYPHPQYLPIQMTINATVCGRSQLVPITSWMGEGCECQIVQYQCLCGTDCLEPNELQKTYTSFCDTSGTLNPDGYGCLNSSFYFPNVDREINAFEITSFMNPILGMRITIPKCPQTGQLVTTEVGLTSLCGKRVSALDGFGLDLGTIANAMNANPLGVIWQAVQPDIWVTDRIGAIACIPNAPAPSGDEQTGIVVTQTPTQEIRDYYFRPTTYLYKIQVFADSCVGSNTQICNGAPCECNSPYYTSGIVGDSRTRSCVWGVYNLVTMNSPIFANGSNNEAEGTCNIPGSILNQIDNPDLSDYRFFPLAYSISKAECTQYNNTCDFVPVGDPQITCESSISVTGISLST
jgi:hypothetical protein